MEIGGFEPPTSAVQGQRSTNWAKPPFIFLFSFLKQDPTLVLQFNFAQHAIGL